MQRPPNLRGAPPRCEHARSPHDFAAAVLLGKAAAAAAVALTTVSAVAIAPVPHWCGSHVRVPSASAIAAVFQKTRPSAVVSSRLSVAVGGAARAATVVSFRREERRGGRRGERAERGGQGGRRSRARARGCRLHGRMRWGDGWRAWPRRPRPRGYSAAATPVIIVYRHVQRPVRGPPLRRAWRASGRHSVCGPPRQSRRQEV